MSANICPLCGKEVMPYKRFLREAEPFKISNCGSCGAQLRRSPKVFAYLVGMILLLVVLAVPMLLLTMAATGSFWIVGGSIVLLLVLWTFVTNYVAWRTIPWIPVESKKPV